MKGLLRWFRRGASSAHLAYDGLFLFGAVLFFALAAERTDRFLATYTSLPPYHLARVAASMFKEILPMGAAGVGALVMLVWAGLRALAYHPLTNSTYLTWLRTTPWQPGKPLPLGPLGATTQDCLVLAAMSLVTHIFTRVDLYVIPMVFLTAYCITALSILVRAGEKPCAYAVAFGLGVPLGLLVWPWGSFAGLVALYGVAHWGLERSLCRFPWEPDVSATVLSGRFSRSGTLSVPEQESFKSAGLGDRALRHLVNDLGWPMRSLRYRWLRPRLSRIDAVLLAFLPGYYVGLATFVYSFYSRNQTGLAEGNSAQPMTGVLSIMFVVAALVRLMGYLNGHTSPISLSGRLYTGRIIIPGYDIVFVTPLAAALAGVGTAVEMARHGFNSGSVAAGSITVFLLILLNGGPSMCRWRLTGAFRLAPGAITKNPEYVKL